MPSISIVEAGPGDPSGPWREFLFTDRLFCLEMAKTHGSYGCATTLSIIFFDAVIPRSVLDNCLFLCGIEQPIHHEVTSLAAFGRCDVLSLTATSISADLPSGKAPTTCVLRPISQMIRSRGLFVRICRLCVDGYAKYVNVSATFCSISSAARGSLMSRKTISCSSPLPPCDLLGRESLWACERQASESSAGLPRPWLELSS